MSGRHYSNSCLLENNSNSSVWYFKGGHLYQETFAGAIFFKNPIGYNQSTSPHFSIDAGTTMPLDNRSGFPRSGGPYAISFTERKESFAQTNTVFKSAPSISERYGVSMGHPSYVWSNQSQVNEINSNVGVLDCDGANYKTSNVFVPFFAQTSNKGSAPIGVNGHFCTNTYDNKPLGLYPKANSNVYDKHPALLCWNDGDNLVVQCNKYADQAFYFKKCS